MPDCTALDPCFMALDGPTLGALVLFAALQVGLSVSLVLLHLRAR